MWAAQARWRSAAIVVACACLLTACGGSDPAEDEIRQQADAFWTALMSGDGETACRLSTPAGRTELGLYATNFNSKPQEGDCEKGVQIFSEGSSGNAGGEYEGGEVAIDGDIAAVKSTAIGFCQPMRRSGDTWLADGIAPPFNPGDPECVPKP